jgi:hypothetical protein
MAPALLPQHDPQPLGLAELIDGMENLPVKIQDVGLGYHRPHLQGQERRKLGRPWASLGNEPHYPRPDGSYPHFSVCKSFRLR